MMTNMRPTLRLTSVHHDNQDDLIAQARHSVGSRDRDETYHIVMMIESVHFLGHGKE